MRLPENKNPSFFECLVLSYHAFYSFTFDVIIRGDKSTRTSFKAHLHIRAKWVKLFLPVEKIMSLKDFRVKKYKKS